MLIYYRIFCHIIQMVFLFGPAGCFRYVGQPRQKTGTMLKPRVFLFTPAAKYIKAQKGQELYERNCLR